MKCDNYIPGDMLRLSINYDSKIWVRKYININKGQVIIDGTIFCYANELTGGSSELTPGTALVKRLYNLKKFCRGRNFQSFVLDKESKVSCDSDNEGYYLFIGELPFIFARSKTIIDGWLSDILALQRCLKDNGWVNYSQFESEVDRGELDTREPLIPKT